MRRLLKVLGAGCRRQPVLFPLLVVAYGLMPVGIVLLVWGAHSVGLVVLIAGIAVWLAGDMVLAVGRARRR